jgi:hypothetical protein
VTPTNATYYWIAKYSPLPGDKRNSPNSSPCGSETMTFGTPKALPQPSITTVLSGAGQLGSHITVKEGTAVTDTAIVTSPEGQPVSGRVTYAAYANPLCSGQPIAAVGGGGATTGTGPSTNAFTLEAGTYYFQAFYSGSSLLKSASTPCGDEVLNVLARSPLVAKLPSAPFEPSSPSLPAVEFKLLGLHVNENNGQITITVQFSGAGTTTATAVVKQGASVARVERPAAQAARKKRCKRGFVSERGRCMSNAPALYGAASLTSSTPGIYRIVVSPVGRVLAALKKGKNLDVTVSATFQGRAGGAPITHLAHALVRMKHPKHRRR